MTSKFERNDLLLPTVKIMHCFVVFLHILSRPSCQFYSLPKLLSHDLGHMIMMMVSNGSQSGYRLKISSHRQTGRQLCNLHHV